MSLTESDRQPTRAELNEIEDQLALVQNGKDKLEEVQEKLIDEFMNTFEKWQQLNANINGQYEESRDTYDRARSMEGSIRLRSVAKARSDHVEIETGISNIAGVKIPNIISNKTAESDLNKRGYGVLGSNAVIDEVAESYETLVDDLVKLAEVETAMKRLLDEIESVSRRVNAFEYKVIPNLKNEKKDIEAKLMERERQELYQLKMVKDKKSDD